MCMYVICRDLPTDYCMIIFMHMLLASVIRLEIIHTLLCPSLSAGGLRWC